MTRLPNLFLVGAPRCASSYLYEAIRLHPDIFMSPVKEPKFLCSDLDSGSEADGRFFIRDEGSYRALFAGAQTEAWVGEACVFNLFSTVAAGRIRALSEDPRAIIMLRDPVEQMYSFHAARRRNGTEDLEFEDALAAEPDRLAGRRLPRFARNVKMYQYRAVASYAAQVARYLDELGRERVHVVIFEDLIRDPPAANRSVLEFLGVDSSFAPDVGVVNAHWRTRTPAMASVLRNPVMVDRIKRLVPRPVRGTLRNVRRTMNAWNRVDTARDPLRDDVRARLHAELAPDIERLSALLGRDLSASWRAGRDRPIVSGGPT